MKFFALIFVAYDKLVNYGFRVHAKIDGASHYMLWAKIALDKKKTTIFELYVRVVEKFGCPLQIHSNFAKEHVLIKEHIGRERAGTQVPYIMGSFVRNQV